MKRSPLTLWILPLALALLAGSCSTTETPESLPLVVNSLEDNATPPAGTTTLRSAIEAAGASDTITFDESLSGGTILLAIVGEEHSTLKGEVYTNNVFSGYQDRDYGRSALYAHKNLTIDASDLPHGITVKWDGGGASHARVLAVYGDLTMRNVTISSGYSLAEAIVGGTQPYTLARGGGLAVWGTAILTDCTIAANTCFGESGSARDRGTYGGGIYADGLDLNGCVISGNTAIAYGAGGGGIYSVGGGDNSGGHGNSASLRGCTVSGNRVTAQHAYGGGIFTLSGGPNNLATMFLTNCTIARNLIQDHPDFPNAGQWYNRGGGVYMGGGSLWMTGCTIAENAISGELAFFSGKPNLGGGGVCATIGNAHTVETVWLQNSIVVGNTLNGAAADWFPGSILDFFSQGYNLLGVVDFSWILVPVPDWMMSSRKRWPKVGDHDGVALLDALNVSGAHYHDTVLSAGTDAGQPAILWYPPADLAADKIPSQEYNVTYVNAGYTGFGESTDDFLNYVILQLRQEYGAILGADFGDEFGDMTGTTWYGPAVTWPSNPQNAAWITFWHNLDTAIGNRLGMAILGDDFWDTFTSGPLGDHIHITISHNTRPFRMETTDQLGNARPNGTLGDIGAIER
ncbi:MAG: hypothetical protein NT147_10630 [Candidatus Aminicenantes bacterium]|nr:hypothetical protein [Candidatus Aminicenantes bacterium]